MKMLVRQRRGLSSSGRLCVRSLRERLAAVGLAEESREASQTVADAHAANYADEARYPPLRPRHTFWRSRTPPQRIRMTHPQTLALQRDREAAYVAGLARVEEKIFAVSPYERDWSRRERRFHNVDHAPLVEPRGAWRVPITAAPQPYASLNFVQHITQTQIADETLDRWLERELDPATLQGLNAELRQSLAAANGGGDILGRILPDFLFNAAAQLGRGDPGIRDGRLVLRPRQASFWVRSGFKHLYPPEDFFGRHPTMRLSNWAFEPRLRVMGGDDGRRLGELAFATEERPIAAFLGRHPLASDEGREEMRPLLPPEQVLYDPEILGWSLSREYLDQAPCFTHPSASTPSHLYTTSSLWDSSPIYAESERKGWDVAELDEALLAAAITAGFSTTVANAHALGFTQLNPLTYPLRHNVVLSDGREFLFATFQLNSLSLHPHPESLNRLWVGVHRLQKEAEGGTEDDAFVYQLFDWNRSETGVTLGNWSGDVLEVLLRFLLEEPRPLEGLKPTPYLGPPRPVPLHRDTDVSFLREQMTFDQTPTTVPDDEKED